MTREPDIREAERVARERAEQAWGVIIHDDVQTDTRHTYDGTQEDWNDVSESQKQ